MYEAKTKQNDASVEAYIEAVADESRRDDCRALVALLRKVSKHEPKMWGPGIVGFGAYHYRYESGHEGDAPLVGFASRKGDLSIYIVAGFEAAAPLLAKLGKHKTGKACLYVKRLADIDMKVLEKLATASVAEMRRRYPAKGDGGR